MQQEIRSLIMSVVSIVIKWFANGCALNCMLFLILALISLFGTAELRSYVVKVFGAAILDIRLLIASICASGVCALLASGLSEATGRSTKRS